MTKNTLIALTLLGFGLSTAQAAGNLKLGPFSAKPFIQSEEKHDDNIYLSDSGKIDSWINNTSVGIGLGAKIKDRHSLDLGYRADILSYSERPKTNNATHQLANLGLTFNSPKGCVLKLTDSFMDTTDPAASNLIDRERRIQNDAALAYSRKPESGLGYGFDVAHTLHDYESSALSASLDRQEYKAGLGVSYPLGGKTRAALGYRYSSIVYEDGDTNLKDNTGHEATLGVDGQISSKVTGQVTAGYTTRSYKDEVAGLRNSFATGSYGLKLDWAFAERTSLAIGGKRGYGESTFGTNRFYTMTSADLAFVQQVLDKVTLTALGTYERDKYPEPTTVGAKTDQREDDIYQAGFNVDYALQQHLKFGLSFLHRARNSNFAGSFDYQDNIAGASVKLSF